MSQISIIYVLLNIIAGLKTLMIDTIDTYDHIISPLKYISYYYIYTFFFVFSSTES